jgi:tryptophanyl-tRNA synthetase
MYDREVFPIPDPLLTEVPVLPGIDGRKMSKSYGNAIFITESEESVREKISRMLTDFHRVRRSDPGDPELSTVFAYHQLYSPAAEVMEITEGCRSARMGCVECKKRLAKNMLEKLRPLREKRLQLEQNMDRVKEIIAAGTAKARSEAARTISEVRTAVGLGGNSK